VVCGRSIVCQEKSGEKAKHHILEAIILPTTTHIVIQNKPQSQGNACNFKSNLLQDHLGNCSVCSLNKHHQL
jgi:hypothetical protein